jgi:hypothetical protein
MGGSFRRQQPEFFHRNGRKERKGNIESSASLFLDVLASSSKYSKGLMRISIVAITKKYRVQRSHSFATFASFAVNRFG